MFYWSRIFLFSFKFKKSFEKCAVLAKKSFFLENFREFFQKKQKRKESVLFLWQKTELGREIMQ